MSALRGPGMDHEGEVSERVDLLSSHAECFPLKTSVPRFLVSEIGHELH